MQRDRAQTMKNIIADLRVEIGAEEYFRAVVIGYHLEVVDEPRVECRLERTGKEELGALHQRDKFNDLPKHIFRHTHGRFECAPVVEAKRAAQVTHVGYVVSNEIIVVGAAGSQSVEPFLCSHDGRIQGRRPDPVFYSSFNVYPRGHDHVPTGLDAPS